MQLLNRSRPPDQRDEFRLTCIRSCLGAANADYCLTFNSWKQLIAPRQLFDASDALPKGAFTLAMRTRILSFNRPVKRRFVFRANTVSMRVSGETMQHEADFDPITTNPILSPGLASGGWHHLALSLDTATGVVQGFFDGQRTMNMTGVKANKTAAATFGGPGGINWFVLYEQYNWDVDPGTGAVTRALPRWSLPMHVWAWTLVVASVKVARSQ
jgi:hypothetical protein